MNIEYDYLYVENGTLNGKVIKLVYEFNNNKVSIDKQIKIIILLIICGLITIGICGIMGLMCGMYM